MGSANSRRHERLCSSARMGCNEGGNVLLPQFSHSFCTLLNSWDSVPSQMLHHFGWALARNLHCASRTWNFVKEVLRSLDSFPLSSWQFLVVKEFKVEWTSGHVISGMQVPHKFVMMECDESRNERIVSLTKNADVSWFTMPVNLEDNHDGTIPMFWSAYCRQSFSEIYKMVWSVVLVDRVFCTRLWSWSSKLCFLRLELWWISFLMSIFAESWLPRYGKWSEFPRSRHERSLSVSGVGVWLLFCRKQILQNTSPYCTNFNKWVNIDIQLQANTSIVSVPQLDDVEVTLIWEWNNRLNILTFVLRIDSTWVGSQKDARCNIGTRLTEMRV